MWCEWGFTAATAVLAACRRSQCRHVNTCTILEHACMYHFDSLDSVHAQCIYTQSSIMTKFPNPVYDKPFPVGVLVTWTLN